MKKMLGLLACLGMMALPAGAQFKKADTPSFEIGGGFAYRSFNAPSFPVDDFGPESRMPMNGWFATAGYNFNEFFGVTTDFDWTRTNVPNDNNLPGKNTFSTLMIGPQIYPIGHHKITPFGHVEFGLSHFSEDFTNVSGFSGCGAAGSGGSCVATDGSFAVGAGGGVDFTITKAFAVRLGEFDWDQTRMFEPGAGSGNKNQNNWKVKAGIIVRFGGK